jgi:hypothetical protein
MVMCASCFASIESRWKFCIYCGAPIIPAAIRPDAQLDLTLDDERPAQRISPVFVLGMVFVGIGIALLATFLALRG